MNWRILQNWTGDRVSSLPLAIVYVTDRCNSKCITCEFWRNGRTDLPVERARSLADELAHMGTTRVLMTGGEPLFHPRWEEVTARFREAGLEIWLATAGLSLGKASRRVAELCQRVTVSLDGATPQTYRAIRGVDGFGAVCDAVRSVVDRGTWVSLRTTIQRENYREIPELVRLAKKLGVREISFLAVDVSNEVAFARTNGRHPRAALARQDLPIFAEVLARLETELGSELASKFIAESRAKLWRLHQYFSALVGQAAFPPVRCNAPRFSAVIRPDGSFQPCFFIEEAEPAPFLPLSEALNTSALRRLRRSIRKGERPECGRCVCPMWRGARELVFANGRKGS